MRLQNYEISAKLPKMKLADTRRSNNKAMPSGTASRGRAEESMTTPISLFLWVKYDAEII